MALIHCKYHSEVLGLACEMDVILPQATTSQIGMTGAVTGTRHPVLYLLHGLSDDHTIWQRRTSIERYAAPLGLAVVMPAVGRSYYTDTVNDQKYWTFISEELPAIARSFFPLSDKREDTFVAGLSMGGYGAFKLAFKCPGTFAAAASLSGALDVAGLLGKRPDRENEFSYIFGPKDSFAGSRNDLFAAADAAAGKDLPLLYQSCGTEDFLYDGNIRFRDHLAALGISVTYHEEPGVHEWGLWDRNIRDVLNWLPLRTKDTE